jgi:hypothetical protein
MYFKLYHLFPSSFVVSKTLRVFQSPKPTVNKRGQIKSNFDGRGLRIYPQCTRVSANTRNWSVLRFPYIRHALWLPTSLSNVAASQERRYCIYCLFRLVIK